MTDPNVETFDALVERCNTVAVDIAKRVSCPMPVDGWLGANVLVNLGGYLPELWFATVTRVRWLEAPLPDVSHLCDPAAASDSVFLGPGIPLDGFHTRLDGLRQH